MCSGLQTKINLHVYLDLKDHKRQQIHNFGSFLSHEHVIRKQTYILVTCVTNTHTTSTMLLMVWTKKREKKTPVVTRCFGTNRIVQCLVVFPVVFPFNVLHIHLSSCHHYPCKCHVISSQPFHRLMQHL